MSAFPPGLSLRPRLNYKPIGKFTPLKDKLQLRLLMTAESAMLAKPEALAPEGIGLGQLVIAPGNEDGVLACGATALRRRGSRRRRIIVPARGSR